ncbi:MAG TPA: hypothetical protein VGM43_24530 [Bryobacteraceae bacterium]
MDTRTETGWLAIAAGGWRDTLTDSPMILSWLAVFVISLPQVIELWTEPDDMPNDLRLAAPGN